MTYAQENVAFAAKLGVPDVFGGPTVAIELPVGVAHRDDAKAAFMLAANLLVRMFRRVHLIAPDAPLSSNAWQLPSIHAAGPLLSALSEGTVVWGDTAVADVAIGIGGAPSVAARKTVVVGFRRGVAMLDREGAAGTEDILAALVAACFGASQAFLHVAAAAGAALSAIAPFEFPLPTRGAGDELDLGTIHLAGVGAVGSAFVYGLAHLRCRGTMVAVDPDVVDTSNLHRYILMRRGDVDHAKATVAHEALAGSALSSEAVVAPYQKYLAGLPSRRIDLLITPVDSEAGRRQLASSLPRRIVNASTTDRYITISRHGFGDGKACLYCLYPPTGGSTTTEQRLASELGLGLSEVEQLLAENAPVDAALVRRVETHRGVAAGTFAEWVGKPLQSFHQRAVCGTATITTPTGAIVAPLGFISAAAGLLLLTELVGGRSLGDEDTRSNYLRLDMLGSPEHADRDMRHPDPGRRCICSDQEYLDVYRGRYGVAPG